MAFFNPVPGIMPIPDFVTNGRPPGVISGIWINKYPPPDYEEAKIPIVCYPPLFGTGIVCWPTHWLLKLDTDEPSAPSGSRRAFPEAATMHELAEELAVRETQRILELLLAGLDSAGRFNWQLWMQAHGE